MKAAHVVSSKAGRAALEAFLADHCASERVIDGIPAWSEQTWIGHSLTLGGARLEGIKAIPRCNATTGNPVTGENDLDVPNALRHSYGHVDLGIYAKVTVGGRIEGPN